MRDSTEVMFADTPTDRTCHGVDRRIRTGRAAAADG